MRSVALAAAALVAAQVFSPPRTGRLAQPAVPFGHVWMQGLMVARVSAKGEVSTIETIHAPGPLGPAMASAIKGWTFAPALADGAPVDAPVLVAAIVRPPSFPDVVGFGDTMEGASRLPPDVPAPLHVDAPPYPPLAVGDGVVVVELSVAADGSVLSAATLTPPGGFDAAALAAARNWRFRPAERGGERVEGGVYVIFGFASPVLNVR